MIQLKTTNSQTLNLLVQDTNKALDKVLQDLSPKELTSFSKSKDLGSILESFMKENPQSETQNRELLQLVKQNPTLKSLSNVTTTLQELDQTLQKSDNSLENNSFKNLDKLKTILTTSRSDIENIDDQNLKSKLENSGVFLESKLKNFTSPHEDLKNLTQQLSKILDSSKITDLQSLNKDIKEFINSTQFKETTNTKTEEKVTQFLNKLATKMESDVDKKLYPNDKLFSQESKTIQSKLTQLNQPEKLSVSNKLQEILSDDLKAVINKSIDELNTNNHPQKVELLKQLDKLNLQIDYYQLLSHLSNSSALFIPYSFKGLKDGTISIKKMKNKKFFCDIDLELQEYGNLHLRLGLFEKKQLNIDIKCQSQELQDMLQENLSTLREKLFQIGVHPQEIRFLEEKKQNNYYQEEQNLQLGFEIKA
jgi:hypothetical protein